MAVICLYRIVQHIAGGKEILLNIIKTCICLGILVLMQPFLKVIGLLQDCFCHGYSNKHEVNNVELPVTSLRSLETPEVQHVTVHNEQLAQTTHILMEDSHHHYHSGKILLLLL